MKVENLYQRFAVQNTEQVKQSQNETAKSGAQVQERAQNRDRVELSSTAREMKKIESVLETTPDVRADKVKAIKEQIEAGTYKVDSKKVANAMLADLLKDLA
ncbi:MAG: flagellar biosynthesis anti-sigma factor FlgM [Thermodesulfobacteria bacterium]|nr:flagellar biosynthesis anti-sigma factor FlgM [Thermodesulfobacteriota bacterium]